MNVAGVDWAHADHGRGPTVGHRGLEHSDCGRLPDNRSSDRLGGDDGGTYAHLKLEHREELKRMDRLYEERRTRLRRLRIHGTDEPRNRRTGLGITGHQSSGPTDQFAERSSG